MTDTALPIQCQFEDEKIERVAAEVKGLTDELKEIKELVTGLRLSMVSLRWQVLAIAAVSALAGSTAGVKILAMLAQ